MTLNEAFRYIRKRGVKAADAIAKARELAASGQTLYGESPLHYNPEWTSGPFKARIVESPHLGLRFHGFADDLAKRFSYHWREYGGYYLDCEFQGETARPAVFRLPHGRLVPGFYDPYNGESAAFLAFDSVTTDEKQAVTWADDFARGYAERESEYQESWRAGQECAQALADDAEARAEICELWRASRRAAKLPDVIARAVKLQIRSAILNAKSAGRKAADLRQQWRDSEGFAEALAEGV